MSKCPVCQDGELRDQSVEQWMRKGEFWVLMRHVPATVCDRCGDVSFTQEVAEKLASLLLPGSKEAPTGAGYYVIYDLNIIDRERDEGVRPLDVVATGPTEPKLNLFAETRAAPSGTPWTPEP